MKPLRNYVLVRVDKPKEKTTSGILLKEDWKELPATATVVATGPEVNEVKPKDRVVISRYAVIELEDPELRMILDQHIMGVIDGKTS